MRTTSNIPPRACGIQRANVCAPALELWVSCLGYFRSVKQPLLPMYFGVLAVGIIGAIVARFRVPGMARALLATALAQALVAVIALIIGLGSPWSPPGVLGTLILNGFFAALFVGSALLFRYAGRELTPAGAGPEARQEG